MQQPVPSYACCLMACAALSMQVRCIACACLWRGFALATLTLQHIAAVSMLDSVGTVIGRGDNIQADAATTAEGLTVSVVLPAVAAVRSTKSTQ
jgi:hypothetical protein